MIMLMSTEMFLYPHYTQAVRNNHKEKWVRKWLTES